MIFNNFPKILVMRPLKEFSKAAENEEQSDMLDSRTNKKILPAARIPA